MELRNRISAKYNAPLPSTLIFDYPTVAAISELIFSSVMDAGEGEAAASTAVKQPTLAPSSVPSSASTALAVGASSSLSARDVLENGEAVDAVSIYKCRLCQQMGTEISRVESIG